MTIRVFYYCWDCWSYNKHHRGKPDFEPRQVEMTYLDEAVRHVNDGHSVETKAEVDED